eukprot:CAMPEP_0176488912 /NCGR_PEP_ID=MMETSP0200_2-20121128/6980_1 /TAXON_ID=947934 /ORGANISM="Chaetoceros sp., Strain GSL56" /LENGTH=479 /DNA_ID=CAMNT_0017885963 /DNA_START=230 /DNA_END=1669 /DNA_ORIENTATION=-
MTEKEIMDQMDGLHPGFLLKRFDTEADFATFRESIMENALNCGFGGIEDEIDEGSFMNTEDSSRWSSSSSNSTTQVTDDMVATGPGVYDAGTDGIFLSMKHPVQWKPNEPTVHHVFTAQEAGYYFLFYQVCLLNDADNGKYLFKEVQSTFKLEFEYKNYDAMGKISYLTAGEMPLPHLYLYFSISYALMLFLWIRFVNGDGNSARKPTIYAIHHLMSSVVLLKALSTFFESVRYHFIRIKGHAELWSFVYNVINFIKGTFLFTVILLIGSGWSFFKPFLSKKERRVIYLVFILQVIDNIAMLVLSHETMGERYYNDWSAILHLVDIVSCCAILIPIVWQVNTLEQSVEAVENKNDNEQQEQSSNQNEGVVNDNDGETKRLQSKLSLFRSFYIAVVAYIYFTRVVVYLFASTLSYDQTWLTYFVNEVGTLLFYVVIGIQFKPTVESEYFQVGSDEGQVETEAANHEDNTIELGAMGHGKK